MQNKKEFGLMFFGDSMFNGDGVPVHRNWVNVVSAKAERQVRSMGYAFVSFNFSVSGDTTQLAWARQVYHTKKHPKHLFITQFGLNDANWWESLNGVRTPLALFSSYLGAIVRRAIDFGAKRCLVLTNPAACPPKPNNRNYSELVKTYNREIASVVNNLSCSNFPVSLLSIDRKLVPVKKYLLADGIHLNEYGHDLYARLVWDRVTCAIEDIIKGHQL